MTWEQLVSQAAKAYDYFTEDELEEYAESLKESEEQEDDLSELS